MYDITDSFAYESDRNLINVGDTSVICCIIELPVIGLLARTA